MVGTVYTRLRRCCSVRYLYLYCICCVFVFVFVEEPQLFLTIVKVRTWYTALRRYKYTCDTGQTGNKLLAQWVHLTNHAAGHSRPDTGGTGSPSLDIECSCLYCPLDRVGTDVHRRTIAHARYWQTQIECRAKATKSMHNSVTALATRERCCPFGTDCRAALWLFDV